MPIPRLSLILLLLLLLILQLASTISGIRKDVSLQEKKHICRTTVQGRYLLSDDNGHSPVQTRKELALKVKIAKPATAGTYSSVFDFCAGRCRHNSESVVHENAYVSDFHHCYSLRSNSSGTTVAQVEAKLAGINVIIGRQGESCDSACKSNGQSCVPSKLLALNQCEIMQKYMRCRGSCLTSIGADQPAEVADDAPRHLNPGACLYTRTQSVLSCDGSHQHTRRLCPCA